jgi:hypothetical protein
MHGSRSKNRKMVSTRDIIKTVRYVYIQSHLPTNAGNTIINCTYILKSATCFDTMESFTGPSNTKEYKHQPINLGIIEVSKF